MKTYPGAYHGFDGAGAMSFMANVSSNRMYAGEFRLDTRVLRRYDNGTVFLSTRRFKIIWQAEK
ncbi:MAG TPA: hypothetical protein ENJ01_08495 [Gammaproteobacteria bacterium]|nr:hypothetical protein [Gammaproteobacteria bacterium]